MAAKHRPRKAVYPDAWQQRVTIHDVFHFAVREVTAHLANYQTGFHKRNNATMIDAVRHFRGISDKLDAFRRMKVREWEAAQAAIPKTEGEST